ncbi:MAG: hypothetical protein IJQ68_04165 [Methanobrevibacter sp.]|uniref:hypothetical protein n=1 Tax=Methanobrevibacter sp. TaxID=66852 RepID=UPI0025E2107B|nr:hypothetical protein [Methanobrevibacter sp.]MBR0271172.1 hypothetical protein [Methanobrevibacter sp.]
MEFVLNNIKYQISDMEVFVAYLLVDKYFESSKYDVHFDFLDDYKKELSFEDLTEGAKLINELKVNFINPNFRIAQHLNGNFMISYQSVSFKNIFMAEAIGVLIALNALIELKPAIALADIKLEVDNFIETQRKKFITR